MRFRRAILSFVALVSAIVVACPSPTTAQVSPANEVVALVLDGVGYGHGRGMSQWGAYGWAVNHKKSWQWILDHYYGGTTLSAWSVNVRVRVRLMSHDGDKVTGVISSPGRAMWAGVAYGALQARETTPNRFDVFASTTPRCPGSTTSGWTRVARNVAGPITFTTSSNESVARPGDVLGLCAANGSVIHYRGTIQVIKDSAGITRVVNDVMVENYLRGVVSREVSTSWGDAGAGAGINALRAQAVAARSYTRSQNRYVSSGAYAQTCDTSACQVYGGATQRASPTAPVSGGVTCESGNPSYECAHTNRAILQTAGQIRTWPNGRIVATEFSASNGPRTAGGTFPAVADPADDVAGNPNHGWTRVIDAHALATAYNLGILTAAVSEPDPALPHQGIWDNRVRLTGTRGSVVVSAMTIRSAFGLPSPGFTVRAYRRGVESSKSMAFIGDSIGVSMTESTTSELPSLLDGVFMRASYDSVQNRCASGCGLSGVGAAATVPTGTNLVVVELGYNAPGTNFAAQIDAVMRALSGRQVGRVAWVNLSELSGRADFIAANRALAAATSRWPNLVILDWRTASAGATGNRNRWFAADKIHLTFTGQAEIARFLRDKLIVIA